MFIFLNQPVDDKAEQEDQSEEGSQSNHGQNEAEQFEVESWHLERQVVSVGLSDITEQNKGSQVLREENELLLIKNECSHLQQEQENPVSRKESCFEEERVETEITGDHHQLQARRDQEKDA